MRTLLAAALLLAALPAPAQDAQQAKREIERYQRMIADSSPAELFELEGEALWKKPQGPRNVSLERCDLGLGAGVLQGAYAQLPRWFADVDRVMDLETRLLHCMTTLQGRTGERFAGVVVGAERDDPHKGEAVVRDPAVEARVTAAAPLPVGEEVELVLAEADPATRTVRFTL